MTRLFLVTVLAVLALAATAQAHYPSPGYAENRIYATNAGGACGRGVTWTCNNFNYVTCQSAWGSHSRFCWVGFREQSLVPPFTVRSCGWGGRVEHYGNVVEHWKDC